MATMNFEIRAQSTTESELLIYGYIGGWENSAREFTRQLKELKATTLKVRINSGGGSLFDGVAIYNALKLYKGHIVTSVDALAASAASIVFMAGDERIMPKNTMLMIHNSLIYTEGNSKDLTKTAALLATLDESMAQTYVDVTGQSMEKICQMMDEESWLNASDALELGFATSVVDEIPVSASINDKVLAINGVEFTGLSLDKLKNGILKGVHASINKPNLPTANTQSQVSQPLIINEENKQMDIQALMQQHPELYKQVQAQGFEQGKQEGIKAERERIQSIENIGLAGHEKLIAEAKFTSGISAEALSMQILAAEKQTRQNFIANSQADAAPLAQIGAGEPQAEGDVPANIMAAFASTANRGRVKNG